MTTTAAAPQQIRSTIPARLDRLRWSPFHTRMVLGLGTAWILDGLSITVASSVTGVLTQSDTLGLTTTGSSSHGARGWRSKDRMLQPMFIVLLPTPAAIARPAGGRTLGDQRGTLVSGNWKGDCGGR